MIAPTFILAALFAVISWRSLPLALKLLIALSPIYLLRISLANIPSTALELSLLAVFAVWIIRKEYKKVPAGALIPWIAPFALLFIAASISVFVPQDFWSALGIWKAYFVEPAFFGLMLLSQFKTRESWRELLKAIGIAAIVLSAVALVQVATGSGIPVPWELERRATGVFDYPNALGLFLAPIVAATAVLAAREKKWIWGAIAICGLIGIALAQTEAALVAIFGATLLTFIIKKEIPRKHRSIAAIILTSLAVFTLAIPFTREKLFLLDHSGGARRSQWTETVQLLYDHPILGAGLNGYPVALDPYHDPSFYEIFQYPHNIILNFWTELGILGVVALIWITMRAIISLQKGEGALDQAALAALLTMLIHGLVDVPFFKNDLALLAGAFLALTLYLVARRRTLDELN